MMNRSRFKPIFCLFFFIFSLFFLSCPGPVAEPEEGTFTISFGTSIGRVAYPPNVPPGNNDDPTAPVIDDLRFEVIFAGLNGTRDETFEFIGDVPLRNSVAIGVYNITMNVYLLEDDSLYAEGAAIYNPVTIVSGPNPDIPVQMHSAVEGSEANPSGNGGTPPGNGGNPSEPVGLGQVMMLEVIKAPESISYEGLPVVLTGMEILIYFHEGGSEVLVFGDGNPWEAEFYTWPITERGRNDPTEWWGIGNDGISGKVPREYGVAEKNQIDYYLVWGSGTWARMVAFKALGVLDLQEIHFYSFPIKREYYIDEVVDFSGVVMELKYNTRSGRFDNTFVKDALGTDERRIVPFHPSWGYSINHPNIAGGLPFLRVYVGNDTIDGQPGSPRLVFRDYALDSILE